MINKIYAVDEFDWEWTKRKVMVITPYYGDRLKQTTYALKNIKTSLDDSEWGVLVGDDGCDHDISDLASIKNVKVIKVRNYKAPERNGCICRNVLIKRCQSEWIISNDPEIHWSGDFFKTICDHPKSVIRAGNVRNISKHSLNSILSNEVDIDKIDYRVFRDFTPNDPVNENSVVIIDNTNPVLMGTWGVHYGLAAPTAAWHVLRGYDEKLLHYGPDDGDMVMRLLKMIDNSFMREIKVGRRGMVEKIGKIKDPQYWYDVDKTKGILSHWHIASNVYATHLYHERLEGKYHKYQKERDAPGFIRNRYGEWGMMYDK